MHTGPAATVDIAHRHHEAIRYIRAKVDQLLALMGTLPLRAEELDDDTLIELDPIGIVADSFAQVLANLGATNRELLVARDEIRTILDAMGAAVVVLNADFTIDECNRLACEWFLHGTEPATARGQPLASTCVCGAGIERGMLAHGQRDTDFALDGRHFHAVRSELPGAPGKTVFLYFDITRQKQSEAQLRLYAQVFRNTAEGLVITDAEQRILEVNDAFCRILGYRPEELRGQTPRKVRSGLHDDAFYADMWRQIRETDHWQGEIIDRARDGRTVPLLETISAVRDADGAVSHYISLVSDISHLKETQSRLDYLAHHDLLTGLPNRLLFNDRLEHVIERAARDRTLFAVLYIDLDRFKTINDSLGHHIGDQVLIQAALRLRQLVRRSDTVARLGGDEFVLLLEDLAGVEEAAQLADKVIDALRVPFTVNDVALHVGCSVGITVYPEDGRDAVSLLKNADAAMYKVKELGRDGYFKYSEDLSSAVLAKLNLENALRVAVNRQQFALHYQPIVDLDRGRAVAVEALIRWSVPDQGAVAPEQFIPVAEETRLIVPLGRWVARTAIEQFRQWQQAGMALDYVSINVSAAQVFHRDFAADLIAVLDDCRLDGRHLQLELTEQVLMYDIKVCQRVLLQLRARGVRVAIDDFGTGYSSLAYLKQLPIDKLKIDRSFVRDIPGDPNDCAIAAAVIGLARTLDLEAVAEGVETVDQERFLRAVGGRMVQGYRYAPPLEASAFVEFMAARSVGVADSHPSR
jgi:diguanylate cyclase (GGDEF)-like protein/PAS domain S-box-containing protein